MNKTYIKTYLPSLLHLSIDKNNMNQQELAKPQSEPQTTQQTPPPVNYLNLEQDGMNKVEELFKTNNVNDNSLMNIINEGNDEFKSVNGRNMTYSEMRSMFG